MRELIVNNYPKSSITEAIKTIRTNLKFSSVNKKIQTILVTSSIAKEGKSFISANLAIDYANSKKKVLLIDFDLRKGRQQDIFNIITNARMGLTNLLIDDNWKEHLKEYISNTEFRNLDVLPTGTIPPNPSALLESLKLEKVLEELKKIYDIIIFDSTPVIGLTDTLIISRLADIVLIVARARKTTPELLENTKQSLENVGANIVGVILNRVEVHNKKYYKSYYQEQ